MREFFRVKYDSVIAKLVEVDVRIRVQLQYFQVYHELHTDVRYLRREISRYAEDADANHHNEA